MSSPTATLARPLHDEDFHAWTLDQAARLRDLAKQRPNEPSDWELLAEEIELTAGSERRACQAFLEHVIAHLLKIEHARGSEPVPDWVREVRAFRHLARALTPTSRHGRAPRTCPHGFEQFVGSWLPERAALKE